MVMMMVMIMILIVTILRDNDIITDNDWDLPWVNLAHVVFGWCDQHNQPGLMMDQ